MRLRGMAAAPGVAIGPIWRHATGARSAEPVPDIRAAADQASLELAALAERVRAAGRDEEGGIFDAQSMMALDPMLVDEAEIRAAGIDPSDPDAIAAVVEVVARETAATLASLPDELLAARAADVHDVGARIARIIAGRAIALPDRPAIAVAEDLPPSVTAELPDGLLLGIALQGGSPVAHAAILARGLGIPCVMAVRGLLAAADEADAGGTTIAVDGDTGLVVIDPDDADRLEFAAADARRRARAGREQALRGRGGATADGRPVTLLANIGRPEDAERAIEAGAEGVGLFRTEFMFHGRASAPAEDEQVQAYSRVMAAFGPDRPVVVRLADIGGDKPIPYLHLAHEHNPFLGIRGIRLAWDDDRLLLTQLRAIARAGAVAGVTPHVMAPMISTLDDVVMFRALADRALAELDREGRARAERLHLGIMVEVPSAALCAAQLAPQVAFFSIGSNDLTQYVLAMDRTNARLAERADGLHPAVLRAIRMTVEGADAHGIEVAVCGELAADPAAALVLVGLGVDELSMDAAALDGVRFALAGARDDELQALAEAALSAPSAVAVRAMAGERLEEARRRAG